jgi:phosphohistidine phosphatase
MKRLILMRHAKSSWADAGQRDFDRPLNGRGVRSATLIGEWLAARGRLPDHALVSSAQRTRDTWAGIAGVIGPRPVEFVPDLYHGDPGGMLELLRGAPDDAGGVLMLGHMPGVGAFAAGLLAKPPEDPDFDRHPTAATTVMDFSINDWKDVSWGSGHLVEFVTPRALEPGGQ